MPVGIPKVSYQFNEDEDSSWIDLYNRLYYERLLFLGQPINHEISNQLSGLMIYLSIQDPSKDIYMFINSPGGGIMSGMAMFDVMHFVKAEVQTICIGLAASMASVILLGGEVTRRVALPHSKVMIHQPISSFMDDQIDWCSLEASEIMKMYDSIIEIYVERTGKPASQISADMRRRDWFMTPEEAQAYGIIDIVAAK